MDIDEPNLESLTSFIGPPLQILFADYYDFNEKKTQLAIEFYREQFKEIGTFGNELYEGILPLLQVLKDQQFTLVVATSKPTVFAEQIIKYFRMSEFFDLIVGSNLDGTRSFKAEIIQYILNHY